jgi:hypothetical protein
MKKNILFEVFTIVLVYTAAHALILLNEGIFWDDWVIAGAYKGVLIDMFSQTGIPFPGYIHEFLFSYNNPVFLYRAITFLLYLFSALLLNEILKTLTDVAPIDRMFISVFFAIFPVNNARISLIILQYSLSHFIFFLAFWLTIVFSHTRKFLPRILSLCLFFVSFFTLSFLSFYVLVLLFLLCHGAQRGRLSESLLKMGRYNPDYILLPILFLIVKTTLFQPYGLYAGYNSPSWEGILSAPLLLKDAFYNSFLLVFVQSVDAISPGTIILGLLTIIALILTARRFDAELPDDKHGGALFLWGAFCFILGVFPYLVVGKIPGPDNWDSRHEMLVPLGASLMLYSSLKMAMRALKRNGLALLIVNSFFIILFVNSNIFSYLSFQRDAYKQTSLMEQMSGGIVIRENRVFLFNDTTKDLNAIHRDYRFYEYSGMMKRVYGDETRFGSDVKDYQGIGYYSQFTLPLYSLKDFNAGNPQYLVNVEHGSINPDMGDTIKLMYYECFEPEKFSKSVKDILKLEYAKMD